MPSSLWKSSERPMYVRTVWVDGFRHAILTPDDPYLMTIRKQRPYSSVSWNSKDNNQKRISRLSCHSEDLENCLRNINLVLQDDKSNIYPQEPIVEKLDLGDIEEFNEDLLIKANPQPLYNFESSRLRLNNLYLNMRTSRTNRTDRAEVKNTELSDRVLQWLDLAGKIDLLAPENDERMTQPRHSWPEIQRRNLIKSKTTTDLRKDSGKRYEIENKGIDHQNFYSPTSANTIENYARQSRNIKITPRVDSTKTKEHPNKIKSMDLKTNVSETRQRIVNEKRAVKKQYNELVNKRLIPDLGCGVKRQVHIFMPDMPKKIVSCNTSRTESLLSQRT